MDMDHTYELMRRKVDDFDRDVFESSLLLGTKALSMLGYQKYQAYRLARTFRRHNHEVMWDLCEHWSDEKLYLSESKKRSQELEEILLAEEEDHSYQRDDSWDATSRREEIRDMLKEE
jgi:Zn-dependent oligopeptidase